MNSQEGISASTPEDVCSSLISPLQQLSSEIPFASKQVHVGIKKILAKFSANPQGIMKLGLVLLRAGHLGKEITDDHPEFSAIKTQLFMDKTSKQTIDYALAKFTASDGPPESLWQNFRPDLIEWVTLEIGQAKMD